MYAIRNTKDNSLAWSNERGWVEDESYDLFTPEEKQILRLPLEGRWVEVG